jgi:hypothetical protein
MHWKPHFDVAIGAMLLGALLAAQGCSKSRIERHRLSGRVTFQGKPVPAGLIIFEPDVRQGNRGPQGYAEILDGRYQTDKFGKGAMTGALVVKISAYPAEGGSGENPGRPLFAPYETSVNVAQDTTTLDFDVPSRR